MKKISLIIPVYNLAQYLQRCLESVLACGYPDLEIICINDGSTDTSGEILERFQKRDAQIRIIQQENQGVSAARNAGLEAVSGELVGFMDGDDVVHPRYFTVLAEALESSSADMAVCGYRTIKGDPAGCWETADAEGLRLLDGASSMKDHTVKCFAWGRLYRREVLAGLGFREDMALGEDRAFHLKLVCAHPEIRIVQVRGALYGYCQRNDSAVAGATKVQWLQLAEDILDGCRAEESHPGKAMYLTESFKLAYSARELCRDDTVQRIRADWLVTGCMEEMKKTPALPLVRRIGYWLMARLPWIYRILLRIKTKLGGV